MMPDYMSEKRSTQLAFWGLGQMMRGAGYAFAFLLAVGLFLAVIWGIGQLLPAESKQAPSPYGALTAPQETRLA